MNSQKVDFLNIGLIVLSLVLAYMLPFRLFLVSYAVLGPLHYLTEINWLREKKFFTHEPRWAWIALLFAFLIVLPKIFVLPAVNEWISGSFYEPINAWLLEYSNGFIFLWLAFSIALVLTKKWQWLLTSLTIGIGFVFLLNDVPLYIAIIGLLIPTLIHVYLFTVLFMVKGSLESKSKAGFAAIALMFLVPVIIAFVDIDQGGYFFSDWVKNTFTENQFHATNAKIAKFLGLGDGTSFFFYEKMELKLQTFIAFAYLYHYLNWFSKTTVIKWHKSLSLKRTIVIAGIWLILVALFIYDYKIGLMVALFFSFLHVLLEFPLNVLSIKSIPLAVQKALKNS